MLGFGLGRFGGAVAMQNKVIEETKDFSYFYMDNYYLKTLVEMGYLGLAFFILLLFGLVLWSLRSIGRTGYTKGDRTRVLAVSMFAGMCGVLVHCYFENIFEVPYMMAYFWSMAGCGSSKEKEKTDGKELPALVRKSRAAGMKVETVIGDKAYSSKENIDAAKDNHYELISRLNSIVTQGNRIKPDEFEFNQDAGNVRNK